MTKLRKFTRSILWYFGLTFKSGEVDCIMGESEKNMKNSQAKKYSSIVLRIDTAVELYPARNSEPYSGF